MDTLNNIGSEDTKNICDGFECFAKAIIKIDEKVGERTEVFRLCKDCIMKFPGAKTYLIMNNHDQMPQDNKPKICSKFSQLSNISESSNKKTLEQQQVVGPECSNVYRIQPHQQSGGSLDADTTSISPKPGIKCCGGDNKLCNTSLYTTTNTAEKFWKLTDDLLWTEESTRCICNHHGCNGSCNCKFFIPYSIRLSHSNCYKMVTE
jgi:hypothetical protein